MGFVRICFIILIENGVKPMYNGGIVYLQCMGKENIIICFSTHKIKILKKEMRSDLCVYMF